jgi:hypothetical protein
VPLGQPLAHHASSARAMRPGPHPTTGDKDAQNAHNQAGPPPGPSKYPIRPQPLQPWQAAIHAGVRYRRPASVIRTAHGLRTGHARRSHRPPNSPRRHAATPHLPADLKLSLADLSSYAGFRPCISSDYVPNAAVASGRPFPCIGGYLESLSKKYR